MGHVDLNRLLVSGSSSCCLLPAPCFFFDLPASPGLGDYRFFIHATHRSSSRRIAAGDSAWCQAP